MICVRVRISGRVQGVGFRYYTRQCAQDLGVRGWVRNLPGGGVEAVLEGERQEVGKLLNLLKTGPTHAIVSGMDISELAEKGYADFNIVY